MCSGTCHNEGIGLMTRNLFLTVCGFKDKSTFPMQNSEIKVFPAGLAGQGQLIPFQTSFRVFQSGTARHSLCHMSSLWAPQLSCAAAGRAVFSSCVMPLPLLHFVPYASMLQLCWFEGLFVELQYRGTFVLEDGLNAASA